MVLIHLSEVRILVGTQLLYGLMAMISGFHPGDPSSTLGGGNSTRLKVDPAPVAQLAERTTFNRMVPGSSPGGGASKKVEVKFEGRS